MWMWLKVGMKWSCNNVFFFYWDPCVSVVSFGPYEIWGCAHTHSINKIDLWGPKGAWALRIILTFTSLGLASEATSRTRKNIDLFNELIVVFSALRKKRVSGRNLTLNPQRALSANILYSRLLTFHPYIETNETEAEGLFHFSHH